MRRPPDETYETRSDAGGRGVIERLQDIREDDMIPALCILARGGDIVCNGERIAVIRLESTYLLRGVRGSPTRQKLRSMEKDTRQWSGRERRVLW